MAICHGSSEGFYMSCGMSWHVMSWRYVMHVPDMSWGMSSRGVMYICHGDMSLDFRICHEGMSW